MTQFKCKGHGSQLRHHRNGPLKRELKVYPNPLIFPPFREIDCKKSNTKLENQWEDENSKCALFSYSNRWPGDETGQGDTINNPSLKCTLM